MDKPPLISKAIKVTKTPQRLAQRRDNNRKRHERMARARRIWAYKAKPEEWEDMWIFTS